MPATSSGYARPELLAETNWLAEHLNDPGIRIVDADDPPAHRRAHIPNAVPIPTHHYLKESEGALHVMGPDLFARLMAQMGIGDDTLVVAYDCFGGLYAARFWWALNYYGHTNVKVLNGGWQKWFYEGRPLSLATPQVEPATFTPRADESLRATREQVLAAIDDPDTVVWDVRSKAEHTGENLRSNRRGGHVPGARNLEWTNTVVSGDVPTWKSAEELTQLLTSCGITRDKRVYTY